MPTIKVLPAGFAVAAAGAAAFFGFTQPPPDHPVVQQSTVHDENESLTAERIVELERTRQIRPAGPIPVDQNANVIEPKR
ncbi:hypothetical protein ABZY44_35315 [Streptomyces sp. NPDC006544]|uniref:hypothetical protein n=1 Tax=Streptomyces sp. NPDC006544 TaxID=3154583 RepID=UPI0033B9DC04